MNAWIALLVLFGNGHPAQAQQNVMNCSNQESVFQIKTGSGTSPYIASLSGKSYLGMNVPDTKVVFSMNRIGANSDTCVVEVISDIRKIRFEYWIGSDLSEIYFLSKPEYPGPLSERRCSIDPKYRASFSACKVPMPEDPPIDALNGCEIEEYLLRPAADFDLSIRPTALGYKKGIVCVGIATCRGLFRHEEAVPPVERRVACMPATNGECVQSFDNCGGDKDVFAASPEAQKSAQTKLRTLKSTIRTSK